jgi:hypothetical protein
MISVLGYCCANFAAVPLKSYRRRQLKVPSGDFHFGAGLAVSRREKAYTGRSGDAGKSEIAESGRRPESSTGNGVGLIVIQTYLTDRKSVIHERRYRVRCAVDVGRIGAAPGCYGNSVWVARRKNVIDLVDSTFGCRVEVDRGAGFPARAPRP